MCGVSALHRRRASGTAQRALFQELNRKRMIVNNFNEIPDDQDAGEIVNRPRFAGDPVGVKCVGRWACIDGVNHCSCWWDSPDGGKSEPCCQCGSTEPLETMRDMRLGADDEQLTCVLVSGEIVGVERHAAVKVPRGETYLRTVERVDRYLPANYRIASYFHDAGNRVLIVGRDAAGWTLEGYVIPRLASGLLFAEEYGGPCSPQQCNCTRERCLGERERRGFYEEGSNQ